MSTPISAEIATFRLSDEDAQKCVEFIGKIQHTLNKDSTFNGPLDLPKMLELLNLLNVFRSRSFDKDDLHTLVDKLLEEYDRFIHEARA